MSDLVTRDAVVRAPKIRDWLRRLLTFDARLLSLLVFVVLAVLVFGTFRDYGISMYDHVQNVYGHYLLSYYFSQFHVSKRRPACLGDDQGDIICLSGEQRISDAEAENGTVTRCSLWPCHRHARCRYDVSFLLPACLHLLRGWSIRGSSKWEACCG